MELIIIRGLPGSGKTTLAREFAARGYDHHEADQYFERDNGRYEFVPSRIGRAHEWCQNKVKGSLSAGHNCVVANTFSRKWEIQPYIDMAHEFGATTKIIEAKGEWKNIHGVPEGVVEKMRLRWESI